jgi:hypothetical protein
MVTVRTAHLGVRLSIVTIAKPKCLCVCVCAAKAKNIIYKNTNHQQMHKETFIINRNIFLHVSTLLGHLQGELFSYR